MDSINELTVGAERAFQCVVERCQSELIRVVLELESNSSYGCIENVEKALEDWIDGNKEALSDLDHRDRLALIAKLAQTKQYTA